MALTLPYPDMDFVPLDILTAAEQDQLVANIEYIASQFPIGTSNIDNSAVTSQKVDFTTLNCIIDSAVDNNKYFGGTYTKAFSVTTPGSYLLVDSFSSSMGRAVNSSNNLVVKIDGTQVLKYRYDATSSDQDWGTNRRTITGTQNIVTLTAGSHTITSTGNLYLYDAVGTHTITALKLSDS